MTIKQKKSKVILLAVLSMFLGSSMVFSMVIMMNKFLNHPEAVSGPSSISFEVEKIKPKKKEEIEEKTVREKRKPTRATRQLAPLPQLGTGLSSIQIEVPGFDPSALNNIANSLLGDMDSLANTVMTEEAVDRKPVLVRRVPANYPSRAQANNITGYVTLSILIARDGSIKQVKVLEANPSGVFEECAVTAVEQWMFEPATYKNQNVEVWAKQTVKFQLG